MALWYIRTLSKMVHTQLTFINPGLSKHLTYDIIAPFGSMEDI